MSLELTASRLKGSPQCVCLENVQVEHLPTTHPIRLGLALNFSGAQFTCFTGTKVQFLTQLDSNAQSCTTTSFVCTHVCIYTYI